MPLVSLIMPSYNVGDFIGQIISSIKKQTYQNWECIIVDDHSTDETYTLAKELTKNDNRFIIVRRPKDIIKGGNSCRNYGYSISKGEYINWVDADDVLNYNMILSKVTKLILNSELDFVVSLTANFYDIIDLESKNMLKIAYPNLESSNPLTDYVTGKTVFYTFGPMWRKGFLNGKKLFDESLSVLQEWEFYIRLLSSRPKYLVLNEVLYYKRCHNESITGAHKSLNTNSIFGVLYTRDKVYQYLSNYGLLNVQILHFFYGVNLSLLVKVLENNKYKLLGVCFRRLVFFGVKLDASCFILLKNTIGLFYLTITKRKTRLLTFD